MIWIWFHRGFLKVFDLPLEVFETKMLNLDRMVKIVLMFSNMGFRQERDKILLEIVIWIARELLTRKTKGVAMVHGGFLDGSMTTLLEVFMVSSPKDLMMSVPNPEEFMEIGIFGGNYYDLIVFD